MPACGRCQCHPSRRLGHRGRQPQEPSVAPIRLSTQTDERRSLLGGGIGVGGADLARTTEPASPATPRHLSARNRDGNRRSTRPPMAALHSCRVGLPAERWRSQRGIAASTAPQHDRGAASFQERFCRRSRQNCCSSAFCHRLELSTLRGLAPGSTLVPASRRGGNRLEGHGAH